MRHVTLAVVVAALAVLAVPAVRSVGAEPGVCEQMTPAKLLEHPDVASAYAEALRSGDAGEVGRIEDALREIRSAHGCPGDVALPAAPLGHPARPHAPRALPPGHPPVDGRTLGERGLRGAPIFGKQEPVTI